MLKRRFTALEIILFIIIIGIFVVKYLNFNPLNFLNKENALRNRFNALNSLIADKNWREAYKYFASEFKSKEPLEDYIASGTNSYSSSAKNITINKIIIKDNIAYIDRNSTICEDANCTSNKTIRGYITWVYENGNWFFKKGGPRCIRSEMYEMPAEFQRALSLLQQRVEEKFGKIDDPIFNCINIKYASLNDAEGYFTFDKNNSSIDQLQILVDNSYKYTDDLTTALLLSHEVNHASNYVNQINTGIEYSCVDNEVAAFMTQFDFIKTLNQGETESVASRMANTDISSNTQLQIISTFLTFFNRATAICGTEAFNCIQTKITDMTKNMITSNPFYQKECNL